MKKTSIILLSLAALAPVSAWALDLAGARASGAVCEQMDGFVRAVKPEAAALVAQVNAGRSAEYARIATQNKQTPAVAGQLAAPQIIASGANGC